MDLSDLVHAVGRLARHRAFRYALVGGAIFLVDQAWVGAGRDEPAASDQTQIVITREEIRVARERFAQTLGQPPSRAEERELIRAMVDREVLVRYALLLGMDEQPAARRRLVQVARFVAENPEAHGDEEMYRQAVELGLHRDDLVVRRQLTDAAERLIRAAIWRVEPSEEELAAYHRANESHFRRAARVRISHVFFSRAARGDDAEEDARRMAADFQRRPWDAQEAAQRGDPALVDRTLPLMSGRELARSFGHVFATHVMELREQSWAGPIRSPHGWHAVFVHEREEAHVPRLSEIRSKVLKRWRHDAADAWFSERLAQLRGEFDIRIEEEPG